jgi:hypothetical protein
LICKNAGTSIHTSNASTTAVQHQTLIAINCNYTNSTAEL